MTEITPAVQKWLKKRVKDRFTTVINQKLQSDIDIDAVVDEITQEQELRDFIQSTKLSMKAQEEFNEEEVQKHVDFDVKSLLSFTSDLSNDDWMSMKPSAGQLEIALDNLAADKPIHVRLAGFETLLESELTNNCAPEVFEALLKSLRDGIADDSRPVFDASLRVHSKLLRSLRSHDVYTNLLNSFEIEYNSKKLHETLPNFNTGINFKLFLHEKLVRVLYLIVKHQREAIKLSRGVDRTVEEMIDQFVVFLNTQNASNPLIKPLTTLNLVSVLEPRANWSRKWIHSLATRRNLFASITKSPALLQNILDIVKNGLVTVPSAIAFSVTDEPPVVFISGDTIEVMTYLHCLNFMSQLCSCVSGRNLLAECPLESPPSPGDFIIALITSLNTLACSTAPRLIYTQSRHVLKDMLTQRTLPADSRLFQVALNPLMKPLKAEPKLWLHTIDMMNSMIESKDGYQFLVSEFHRGSANIHDSKPIYPCSVILGHVSDLLRQPFAVMNIELLVEAFTFIGKLFESMEDILTIQETLHKYFFPAIGYFYSKIGKYCIGNETKTQYLDRYVDDFNEKSLDNLRFLLSSAAKVMLTKIVSHPVALKFLSEYPIIFEEMIRTAINPLRHSWKSNETVSFISSAALFHQGRQIIGELIPQTFSMTLADVCENLQNPLTFFDPWSTENTMKFLHLIALLTINTECFKILLLDEEEEDSDEYDYPRSFCELLKYSVVADSPYHEFNLRILDTMIWNLNILIQLLNIYDLQSKLLELQEDCLLEVRKFQEKSEEGEEEEDLEEQPQENAIDELHTVYVIDESSYLRHRMLRNSFSIKYKLGDQKEVLEKSILFSHFPPPESDDFRPASPAESSSELDEFLQECKPGLRDNSWVMQVKKFHKDSQKPMKHTTLINLLDQMEKAIPTVEWVDVFRWKIPALEYPWLPEDDLALDLVIRYAKEHCEELENELKAKENLRKLFAEVHAFIMYEKPREFYGFDWFLATIFVICNGNVEKCKVFVKQFVRFPSAMFMWNVLGLISDRNNNEEAATELIFAQHVESVLNEELPAVNYALKNEFGVKWWMLCKTLLAQCFWGVLEWSEIVHFFAICIINTPDYIVYYCVALLRHCESILMQDIVAKKSWPENMDFSGFQCHNHLAFIERLAKRHRNKILSSLTQRKLVLTDE